MLELRLARGPLDEASRRAVVQEYGRLAGTPAGQDDFRRWTEQSPAGPALHGLLRAPDGRLAGHCCLFPFPLCRDGRRLVGAKAEYFFVHEDFRKDPIANLPGSGQPPALGLLKALYRHGSEQLGWDPILISAAPEVAVLHRLAGAVAVHFELTECLLILRPLGAARLTPNLSRLRRMILVLVGAGQMLVWRLVGGLCRGRAKSLRALLDPGAIRPRADLGGITFPLDPEFLSWRYPKSGFELLEVALEPGTLLAVTSSTSDYLRVVDSNLDLDRVGVFALVAALVRQARRCGSLGVRWAVYDHPSLSGRFIRKLRSLGLICARHKRLICMYTKDRDSASAAQWQFSDMIVTFDRR